MSTIQGPVISIARTANADLSSSQYFAVKPDTAEGDVVLAGAGELALGILQNTPISAELADVAVEGSFSKAKAGGTISEGNLLKVDAAGKLIATTTADDIYVARALQDAVTDDVFSVQVTVGYQSV